MRGVRFNCPRCGHVIEMPVGTQPGSSVKCESCYRHVKVPPPKSNMAIPLTLGILACLGLGVGLIWYSFKDVTLPDVLPTASTARSETSSPAPRPEIDPPLKLTTADPPVPVRPLVATNTAAKPVVVRASGQDIRIGDSRETVVRSLGRPPRTIRAGVREILMYDDYEFDLEGDKVVEKRLRAKPQRRR